ncbi:unnamed protein product [Pseudo-nitzschia multistriata]|uniref:CBM6 domain-containing protein n=1 Tax=Pseudo-nitzschia multistriata TaxID=183589 RepID=A0A448ZMR3_9STRA|nr:unnamed protein product [Pseudo-nitzschia multistriata]
MQFYRSNFLLSVSVAIHFLTIANGAPSNDDILYRMISVESTNEFTLRAKDSMVEGSRFAFNKEGYEGDGFIDFGGAGTSAFWSTNIQVEGEYDVTIRYASRGNRPVDLLINNNKIGTFQIKKAGNDWNTWKEETIRVNIPAGKNQILKLLASANPGPNVDNVALKLVRSPTPPSSSPNDQEEPIDYAVILRENECLPKGSFEESENGKFDFGLDGVRIVVRNKTTLEILWSLRVQGEEEATLLCMERNGSLVTLQVKDSLPLCDTKATGIYERTYSFTFGINNVGKIAVLLDNKHLLWTGGLESDQPSVPLTPKPMLKPTSIATAIPSLAPTPRIPIVSPNAFQPPDEKDLQYKAVLSENEYFGREEFAQSLSGEFEIGLSKAGSLLVRKTRKTSEVVWVLEDSMGRIIIGDKLYMQNDGNLVMRRGDNSAVWTSKSANADGPSQYSFGINNCGRVAVFGASNSTDILWTAGIQGNCIDKTPSDPQTIPPVSNPMLSPSPIETPSPESRRPTSVSFSVVLRSNEQLIGRGKFASSPNGQYEVGLDSKTGRLIIMRTISNNELWTLRDKSGDEILNISKIYMQSDGNLVMKSSSNEGLWNSETSQNPGGEFRIDDSGQLSVNFQGTPLWIDGLPRAIYTGPSSSDLIFPVRGYFYYAWYPETWTVGGEQVKYRPNLGTIPEGTYRSGDPVVVKNHVEALDYAWADLSIVSWWGPSDRLDRARITQLLDETADQDSSIKWTVYYEDEMNFNKSVDQLMADLDYLKEWFAWHESWAHKDGKPVIFIWNESNCEVADRWTVAAKSAGWYLVLKLFKNYLDCTNQPDSWHQYGVGRTYLEYPMSFTIGPGFFRADADQPEISRAPIATFCSWVAEMNLSNKDWQLVVSFNEWGEGTAVESAVEWQSDSGYGSYLDCLHDPNVLYTRA